MFIPAETRRKLVPKSVECTFIGYAESQGTRVYRLYQPETGKTITLRDVVFDEADNQKNNIPAPAINPEGGTYQIPPIAKPETTGQQNRQEQLQKEGEICTQREEVVQPHSDA